MRYVVASIVLLITCLSGIVANLYIFKMNRECAGDKSTLIKNYTATTLIDNIKRIDRKQWGSIIIVSLFLMYVSFSLYCMEMPILDMLEHISVAIVLYIIAIIDSKTYKIPNVFVFGLLGIGFLLFVTEILLYQDRILYLIIQKISGLFICVVLFYVLSRITKDGIGMGDVKVIAVMGWMIGLSLSFVAVMFSLLICSIVAVGLLISKKKNKSDKIPFGPFLFLGYIVLLMIMII